MYSVAKSLRISTRALSKITGVVTFEPGRHNVGLNMKFSTKSQQVMGYTRKIEKSFGNNNGPRPQWEFSEKAVEVIGEYLEKFPRIFELLEENPNASTYYLQDLQLDDTFDLGAPTPTKVFKKVDVEDETKPDQVEALEENGEEDVDEEDEEDLTYDDLTKKRPDPNFAYIRNIKSWLKGLEVSKLPRVPIGSIGLPKEGIKEIEQEATKFAKYAAGTSKLVVYSANPTDLIKPAPSLPLKMQSQVRLGDRIMVATSQSQVPFGYQGTVVAVKVNMVDIILDVETIGGTDLDKR
jgi:hypothetical protein